MVDIKLIKETITELQSANVDKETIFSTLKDIGVDQGDIEKYYAEVNKIEERPIVEKTIVEEPKIVAPEIAKINSKVEPPKPTSTTEDLESATKDVIDIEKENIIEEKPKFNITPVQSENVDYLKKQIIELDEKLIDIKSQMTGLTKIMKDILEENRNILNKLK